MRSPLVAMIIACIAVTYLQDSDSTIQTGMPQTVTRRVNRAAVTGLAQKMSSVFERLRCDTVKAGTGCKTPGLQQKWFDLAEKVYKTQGESIPWSFSICTIVNDQRVIDWAELNPLVDILADPNVGLLPQISGTFTDASAMLLLLRTNLEKLIISQHRISQLTAQNYSAVPAWDPTNPVFKENNNPMLEGKNFTKPVLKQSTLRYPNFVSKSDRTVQIAANASDGLETFFVSNLINPKYSFLRWQRFVSFTGLTRQFPAMYDPGLQDDRLTSWYNMASQVPKRALFLLDVSPSMRDSFDLAKNVISTILSTLIPEDLVNVILMDDQMTSPYCFENLKEAYLVPAKPANVQNLQNFVTAASIGKFQSSIYAAISVAISMFEATDALVTPAEVLRSKNPKECLGYRCAPVNEYLFVVTDGNFELAPDLALELENFKAQRASLHLFGLAVGSKVDVSRIQVLTCGMNGKLVTLEPPSQGPNASGNLKYESYILNEMKEYFQLVAAPIARNRTQLKDSNLYLDVTWDLPKNPYGSEVMITLAQPCFGDTYSDTPTLLGVVSVDLVWLKPGDEVGDSLFSYWKNIVLPPIFGLDYYVVFTKGNRGTTLLDRNLADSYTQYLTSLDGYPSNGIRHYLWTDFIHSGAEGSKIQQSIFDVRNGSQPFVKDAKARTDWNGWMFESFAVFKENVTLAWVHLIGHPIVIILRSKGLLLPGHGGNMTFIPTDRDLLKVCDSCWSFPNRNILSVFTAKHEEPQSWIYIPLIGYLDSVTYLKSDILELPPICLSGNYSKPNVSRCNMQRMNNLMSIINDGSIRIPAAYICGSGVLKQTKDEILLTSVIDFLWNDTFSNQSYLDQLNRVFLSTPFGVFRTRGHPSNEKLIIPKLYEPTSEPWYLRAISSGGWGKSIITPPTISYFDTSNPRIVMTLSSRVKAGYNKNEIDDSISDTAAIIGAEVHYSKIHEFLYGSSAFRGISPQSNFQCGGSIRCYVIDENAAVVMHPDFNHSNEFSVLHSRKQAVFFGSIEPILMQLFVDIQFMVESAARDVTFTEGTYWGALKTWRANESLVPFRQIYGLGNVIVDRIPYTNTYLIVIDNFKFPVASSECGVISTVCAKVFFPVIIDLIDDICLSDYDSDGSNFRKVSSLPLIDSFDIRTVVAALQLFDNCPSPFSDWIWQLFIAGAGCVFCIVVLLSVHRSIYIRNRNHWIEQGHAGDIRSHNFQAPNAPIRRKHEIIEKMLSLNRLLSRAHDFDDFKISIQALSDLLIDIASLKEQLQDDEEENLEILATVIGKMLSSTHDLQDRLRIHNRSREARNSIKAGIDYLRKELTQVSDGLSADSTMPAVRIHGINSMTSQTADASNQLEQEKKFYSSFYPHVFKFNNEAKLQVGSDQGRTVMGGISTNMCEVSTPRSNAAEQTDISCMTESLRSEYTVGHNKH